MSTFPSFDDASGIKRGERGVFFVSLPPLADFTLSMLGILPTKKGEGGSSSRVQTWKNTEGTASTGYVELSLQSGSQGMFIQGKGIWGYSVAFSRLSVPGTTLLSAMVGGPFSLSPPPPRLLPPFCLDDKVSNQCEWREKRFQGTGDETQKKKIISARTPRSKQDRKPCSSILLPFSEPCFVYGSMEDGEGRRNGMGERKV